MDKFGRFPSHYAAERGNADCLDILASYDEVEFIFQQMLDKSKGKGENHSNVYHHRYHKWLFLDQRSAAEL